MDSTSNEIKSINIKANQMKSQTKANQINIKSHQINIKSNQRKATSNQNQITITIKSTSK